jgi:hypothetical protein
MRELLKSRVPGALWLLFAVVALLLFLQLNRYDVARCTEDGTCIVLDRLTGNLGYILTPLARQAVYREVPEHARARLDSLFRAVAP